MKLRSRPSQQVTVKNQLKVRLIVIGSALALAAIVGTGIFIWLNIGAPDRAMAASASLNGVINSYLRVNSISSRSFTADNLSGNISDFAAGRTVMIYQVKGASITVSNSADYGTITDLNSAGLYEFAVVSAISGSGPYTITVASLLNSYDASGAVQLISVPTYTDATIAGTVTATPWDAAMGRGGVVAMQVANDLTLGGNISVTGQGFKGGAKGGTSSVCPDDNAYKSPSDDYGAKGEGISDDGSLYGRAPQANGGGGGNPHNAGGAGGGNYTYGGNGGVGAHPGSCQILNAGGLGGKQTTYTSTSGRIFFGGGGGSGQQNNGLASSGGNGGGVIVIRAKNVKSTCGNTYGIIADGVNAPNTLGGDGAGGGGAGGVVVLDVQSYTLSCNILVHASGGNGGNVTDPSPYGGGAGGGIGVILEVTPSSINNTKMVSTNGAIGKDCASCTSNTATAAGPIIGSKLASTSIPGTGVITLPVKLLSFSGIASGRNVELSWITATEVNNDYFAIERSADGVKFDSIGFVTGSGNSASKITYGYTDKQVPGTAAYYRLKQTDFDGVTTYSKIVNVILSEASDATETVDVYPNPASDQVTVRADGLTSVRIINQKGAVLYSQNVTETEHTIDVSAMVTDMYLVEVIANGKKTVKKLVIKH